MPKILGDPVCLQGHSTCFAYRMGMCRILMDTDFGDKKICPFFKTKYRADREWEETYRRLIKLGRKDRAEQHRKTRAGRY